MISLLNELAVPKQRDKPHLRCWKILGFLFVAHDENPHTRPVYVCLCLSYVWRCLSRGPNVTSVFEYFCVSPVKCLCVFIDEWCLSTLDSAT